MAATAETGIVCGEGRVVDIDPTNARDIGLIRQAVLRGWLKAIPDLEAVSSEMKAIAHASDDERIIVAAGSVRVAVVDALRKAYSSLAKSADGAGESAAGSNAPAEMFREILIEVRNASAHQHPAEADSEPAGDD